MIPPDQGPLLTHYTRLALQRIDQLEAALKISEAKLRASDAMLRDTQQRLLGLTREIKVARKQVLSTVACLPCRRALALPSSLWRSSSRSSSSAASLCHQTACTA